MDFSNFAPMKGPKVQKANNKIIEDNEIPEIQLKVVSHSPKIPTHDKPKIIKKEAKKEAKKEIKKEKKIFYANFDVIKFRCSEYINYFLSKNSNNLSNSLEDLFYRLNEEILLKQEEYIRSLDTKEIELTFDMEFFDENDTKKNLPIKMNIFIQKNTIIFPSVYEAFFNEGIIDYIISLIDDKIGSKIESLKLINNEPIIRKLNSFINTKTIPRTVINKQLCKECKFNSVCDKL